MAFVRARGATLLGVEIAPHAESVVREPFARRSALLLGAEGDGLTAAQLALCDRLVYIPQCGNGTASLNVAVAGSIVMHRCVLHAYATL